MAILYVGIDLAKNVFAVHGVDEHGKLALVRPKITRDKLHDWHGSLLGHPPRGAAVRGSGPRGAADGAEIRRALHIPTSFGHGFR